MQAFNPIIECEGAVEAVRGAPDKAERVGDGNKGGVSEPSEGVSPRFIGEAVGMEGEGVH
ncbi:hypothetical protein Lal_00048830 [Lupinus albus]|nr:hypothetical protein Lal_00048830 [Lupinus albus]